MVIADGPFADRWLLGLLVYVLVVVLELGPPLLLAAILGRHRFSLPLTVLSCGYFLVPFVVGGPPGYNNFVLRASIVPIFTLMVLATRCCQISCAGFGGSPTRCGSLQHCSWSATSAVAC